MNTRQRADLHFALGLAAALALLGAFIVLIHFTAPARPVSFTPAAERSLGSPSHVVRR